MGRAIRAPPDFNLVLTDTVTQSAALECGAAPTESLCMESIEISRGVWIRRPWRNAACAIFCCVWAFIFLILSVTMIIYAFESPLFLLGLVFTGMFTAAGVQVTRGSLRMGIRVDETEVVVRNPATTNVLAFSEIERFEVGSFGTGRGASVGVVLVPKSGRKISVWALGSDHMYTGYYGSKVGYADPVKAKWEPTAAKLNALLKVTSQPQVDTAGARDLALNSQT